MELRYQFAAAYPKRKEGITQPWTKTFTLDLCVEYDPHEDAYTDLEVRISHQHGDLSQPMEDLGMMDKSIKEMADSVDWRELYQHKVKYSREIDLENEAA